MTLGNLGYTGATNANYITNNNQLTNGAGYLVPTDNVSSLTNDAGYLTDAGVTQITAGANLYVSNNGVGNVTIGTNAGTLSANSFKATIGENNGYRITEGATLKGALFADTNGTIEIYSSAVGYRPFRMDTNGAVVLQNNYNARGVNLIFYDVVGLAARSRIHSKNNNLYLQNYNSAGTLTGTAYVDSVGGVVGSYFQNATSGGRLTVSPANQIELHWNNALYYNIDGTGFVQLATASDASLKQTVGGFKDATSIALALNPVRYTYKQSTKLKLDNRPRYGFIAQDLEQILPEAVDRANMPGKENNKEEEFRVLSQDFDAQLLAVLTKTIQELEARIRVLEAR